VRVCGDFGGMPAKPLAKPLNELIAQPLNETSSGRYDEDIGARKRARELSESRERSRGRSRTRKEDAAEAAAAADDSMDVEVSRGSKVYLTPPTPTIYMYIYECEPPSKCPHTEVCVSKAPAIHVSCVDMLLCIWRPHTTTMLASSCYWT
jgi:hypothetical protein